VQKPKLAVVLPAVQFVFAAILLQWSYRTPIPRGTELYVPTSRLICRGLNAPALLFSEVDYYFVQSEAAPTWTARPILGFYADDLFFLLGVIVVWYFAGRALDLRATSPRIDRHRAWPR